MNPAKEARIMAGADALRTTGYTGCICLFCADRDPLAAAARQAVLTAIQSHTPPVTPVEDLPRFRDRFTDEEWAARQADTAAAVADEHSHGGTATLDDGCGV